MSRGPIVFFDVMSTLVTEPFEHDVPRFFGLDLDELFRLKNVGAWIDFECGRMDAKTYAERFFVDGRALDLERFEACLFESFSFMDGVEALLEELHERGVAMHALSNYSEWYRLIEDKLRLSRFMSWRFVSCHTGVRKPDPDAYLIPTRALGVAPKDCVFVDDRKKNVDAAAAVGMQAISRTESIVELRAALARVGILG